MFKVTVEVIFPYGDSHMFSCYCNEIYDVDHFVEAFYGEEIEDYDIRSVEELPHV